MMHFELFKSTSRQSKRYQFTYSSPWSSNLKLHFTTTKSSTFSGPPWRDWQEGGTETRDASTIPVMICGWHLYFGCTCKEVTFQWRHQDYLQSISNFGCLFLRNNTVLLDRRHGCWLKRFQYVLIIFQFFGNISQHYLNNKTFTFQLCPLTWLGQDVERALRPGLRHSQIQVVLAVHGVVDHQTTSAKIRQVGYQIKGLSMNFIVLQFSCLWVR